MRILGIAFGTLFLVGCVTRVNAPSVRPTWLQSPEGEWQEILMDMRMALHIPRYRANELRVREVKREQLREHNDAKDFLRRRMVRTDSVTVTYEVHGPDGWRATASALFIQASDIEEPIRIFRRRDPDVDDRTYHSQEFRSIQRMQLTADSSKWWTMERASVRGAATSPTAASIPRLTRGERELTVFEVSPGGHRSARTSQWTLIPEAQGLLVQDGEVPIAVVQRAGGSLLGANDMRIWLPSGITAEERQERIAMLFMLLIGESRHAFGRGH